MNAIRSLCPTADFRRASRPFEFALAGSTFGHASGTEQTPIFLGRHWVRRDNVAGRGLEAQCLHFFDEPVRASLTSGVGA
jgi:hypothetical protein